MKSASTVLDTPRERRLLMVMQLGAYTAAIKEVKRAKQRRKIARLFTGSKLVNLKGDNKR